MAEFNGKQGRWVTTKDGRKVFIEDEVDRQEREIREREEQTKKLTAEKQNEDFDVAKMNDKFKNIHKELGERIGADLVGLTGASVYDCKFDGIGVHTSPEENYRDRLAMLINLFGKGITGRTVPDVLNFGKPFDVKGTIDLIPKMIESVERWKSDKANRYGNLKEADKGIEALQKVYKYFKG